MDFAFLMSAKVWLALKELCALCAVPLPQAWQVLYRFGVLKLGEMLRIVQIGVHLVEIAGVAARLLLGVLSAYGRHVGLYPRPSGVVAIP